MSKSTQTPAEKNGELKEKFFEKEITNPGIFVRGYIGGRTRKFFENCQKWRYTYTVNCNNQILRIYSWNQSVIFTPGIVVEIPLYISTYADKNGVVRVQYNVAGESQEEDF